MNRRNRIGVSEHFSLHEFENERDGLVVLHPLTLESLEACRTDLCKHYGREIAIVVTCGTRTETSNRALAQRYGWTDTGGRVARNSKHLPKHGGIAVDWHATFAGTQRRCSLKTVAQIAWRHWDVVLDHYPSHIHTDNRERAKGT